MEAKECKFYLKDGKCSHGDAPQPFVSECIGIQACEAWQDGIEAVGGQGYKIGYEQGFKAGMQEEASGGHNSISYLEGHQEGEKAGTEEVLDFVKSYIDNEGRIVEKYTSAPHYVSAEWQLFVALLDTINRGKSKLKSWGIKED